MPRLTLVQIVLLLPLCVGAVLAGPFRFVALAQGAPSARPLPEHDTFVRATRDNLVRSQRQQFNYAYKERRTEFNVNPFGRIGTGGIEGYEVTPIENGTVIIKKIRKGGHGDGHHGGAWKVAYADFVTAMMAFFLLLWLLNVTTDVQKRGIADYFEPTIAMKSGTAPLSIPASADETHCSASGNMLSGKASQSTASRATRPQSSRRIGRRAAGTKDRVRKPKAMRAKVTPAGERTSSP